MMRFLRDRRGVSAVEFAVIMPLLLTMAAGVTEIGRLVAQADAVDKSLRAAAVFAARSTLPLDTATETSVENLVRTGTPDGSGRLVVGGWDLPGANLDIDTREIAIEGRDVTVLRLSATVPFNPLLPGVLGLMGLDDLKIRIAHEQAYLGV